VTYKRFEDLPVWQAAMALAERVFRLTDDRRLRIKGDLANQLERAALSISNNIAEGFERGTTPELLTFVYYARGSAGEVRSMLLLCERLGVLSDLKSEISDLKSVAE
jgi:four helix bundle protein